MNRRVRIAFPAVHGAREPALTPLRQEQIVSRLHTNDQLHVSELASVFGVCTETIRRDLKQLEAAGKLKRVRGGALRSPNAIHQPHEERSRLLRDEKNIIARLAKSLVTEGQSVFLGAGTTMLALARSLVDGPPARFVTNMIEIGITLSQNRLHDVRLTAGRIDATNHLLEGEDTIESVERELFDIAITGTSAIDREFGLLDHSTFSSTLRRRLRHHARMLVTLADHSKFDARAPHRTLPLAASEIFVTDRPPSAECRQAIESAGSRLMHP